MKKINNPVRFWCMMLFIVLFYGCETFLEEKPSKDLVIASTIADLQALMDAGNKLNLGNYPGLLEARTDDVYIGPGGLNRLTVYDQNIYLFDDDYQEDGESILMSWFYTYSTIAIANTVMDELSFVKEGTSIERDIIQGTALFHRALGHFLLAQVFCDVYEESSADQKLGIPLKKTSDTSEPTVRSTIHETYDFIEKDLLEALELLPENTTYLTRPNKAAAHALLARFYLSKSDFENSLFQSEKALEYNADLIDFNELNSASSFPIAAMNKETLFFAYSFGIGFLHHSRECYIDSVLYGQYDDQDIRKKVYFRALANGKFSFKGTYMGFGSGSFFVGPTTSEMYLTSAECYVRKGEPERARETINTLLKYRWERDYIYMIEEEDPQRLLDIILMERRKELIHRGVRWTDIRRLNLDARYRKDIVRKVERDDNIYTLPANSSGFIYKIPRVVINFSGIVQN
ncbi:RagB/SusD family nutrient uptake outer membrane protein [Sphingobacterium corticibacterium]|nr:RagB/SusD family nutrient uptake outer membrane protein [Sphingobacterium corticibacterium]